MSAMIWCASMASSARDSPWRCFPSKKPFGRPWVLPIGVKTQAWRRRICCYPMNKRVLITGGSGLVGRHLCQALASHGDSVHILTRVAGKADHGQVRHFTWDVESGYIDPACLEGVTHIVHLAGENIGALPWSNRRKKAIVDSRIDSISILYRQLEITPNRVKAVVAASATGYYGDRGADL